MPTTDLITLQQLAGRTGISAARLHGWIVHGVLVPVEDYGRGRGNGFRFSESQVRGVMRRDELIRELKRQLI